MTAVLVFGRAPVPGAVKTRLIPALGAVRAAALYRRMLERMLASAREAALGPVMLCAAPEPEPAALAAVAARHGAALGVQRGADLGQRMHHALAAALRQHARALLAGSDCPALDAAVLRRADAALAAGAQVVLVPAVDGGYVLVGASRPYRRVFEDVPWSTSCVMAVTRRRLEESGLKWRELAPLRDVDRAQDLDLLPPDL